VTGRFHRGLEAATLTVGAVVVALAIYAAFLAANRLDPLEVYRVLWLGAFGTRFSIETTLTRAAPLMLTALCVAIPARAGLLVIGGEGALVVGGIGTVLGAVALDGAPPAIAIPLALLAGAASGGLWIGLAGALQQFRGVNETISTLLFNYIAIALLNHLVSGPIRDFSQTLKATSWPVPRAFMIGSLPGLSVHWGLAFGVVACLLAYVVLRHTTFGFATRILGGNLRAAQVVGLPVARLALTAAALGGAAAGLAGALEVLAVHGAASISLVVGYGYAGILVAFVARQNALAIVPVALLVGGISASGGLLQRRFDMPDAATTVLEGCIFLTVLASNALYGRIRFLQPPRARGGAAAAVRTTSPEPAAPAAGARSQSAA
jgi:simple sugar transport system permease protein